MEKRLERSFQNNMTNYTEHKNIQRYLKIARSLAHIMDNKFSIFGMRFGLDPIIGIIPGGGDTVSFLISAYMIWVAYKMNLPKGKIIHMAGNIFVDFLIGLVPFIGDIGDFVLKPNIRNYHLLEKYSKQDVKK